jgi:hypothetical protein
MIHYSYYSIDLLCGILLAACIYVPPFVHEQYCIVRYNRTRKNIAEREIETICGSDSLLYCSKNSKITLILVPLCILGCVAMLHAISRGRYAGHSHTSAVLT